MGEKNRREDKIMAVNKVISFEVQWVDGNHTRVIGTSNDDAWREVVG